MLKKTVVWRVHVRAYLLLGRLQWGGNRVLKKTVVWAGARAGTFYLLFIIYPLLILKNSPSGHGPRAGRIPGTGGPTFGTAHKETPPFLLIFALSERRFFPGANEHTPGLFFSPLSGTVPAKAGRRTRKSA